MIEASVETWSSRGRAGDTFVAEHAIDSGLTQGVELQRHVLAAVDTLAYPMMATATPLSHKPVDVSRAASRTCRASHDYAHVQGDGKTEFKYMILEPKD